MRTIDDRRPNPRAQTRRVRSAHDSALQTIGLGIVKGDYPIGALLPAKDDLMAMLDVSHTTLREALQTLTAKGMVVARAKVGTWVLDEGHWNMFDADILGWRLETGISASFLAMLFEVRQSLEPAAAALAASRRQDSDVVRLRGLAEMLQFTSGKRSDFVDADVAFHQCILEAAANPFMRSLAATISTALTASFTLSSPTSHPELSRTVQQQHMAIVDAIDAHDPQRASDAMKAVIKQGWMTYTGQGTTEIAVSPIVHFQEASSAPVPNAKASQQIDTSRRTSRSSRRSQRS